MEQGVLAAVVVEGGVAGALQRLAQPPRPGGVEAVRRAESGRAHLQDLPEPQGVLQRRRVGPPRRRVLSGAGRTDERTAVPAAPRLHQPLVLKGLQDLAQRHPAHPEPLGQLPLRRQPLARRDQAEADHLEDLFQRLLEAVARPHRPEHRGEAVVVRPRRAALVRAPRRRARVSHPAVPPSQAMVVPHTLWPSVTKEEFPWHTAHPRSPSRSCAAWSAPERSTRWSWPSPTCRDASRASGSPPPSSSTRSSTTAPRGATTSSPSTSR